MHFILFIALRDDGEIIQAFLVEFSRACMFACELAHMRACLSGGTRLWTQRNESFVQIFFYVGHFHIKAL